MTSRRGPQGPLDPNDDGEKKKGTMTIGSNDAWRGNPNAKVTVVEFADFECAYCKRAAGQFERLYAAYGDRVLRVQALPR